MTTKPTTKSEPDATERMRLGREQMAERCEHIASLIAKEAGVKKVDFNSHGGLSGRAWYSERRIQVPRPRTRQSLYVYAHECAHIALEHEKRKSIPSHRIEYEAERWAHEALRRHDIAVPKKQTERAKEYVAHKIHQAVRRGAKTIDKESFDWCREHASPSVKKWLKANPDGVRALSGKSRKEPRGKQTVPHPPNTQTKEDDTVTALITAGAQVAEVVPASKRDDLTAWLNLYMATEVEPGSNTFRAKVGDIKWFLTYFQETTGGFDCDQWTRSVSKSFLTWIQKQKSERTEKRLAPNTCRRIIDTCKRAAKWIHRQRPFLAGYPFEGLKDLKVDEPDWQGLTDLEVRRMKSAAEQLVHIQTRGDQLPKRNYAMLLVLLDSGLRAFELAGLEVDQYDRGRLLNIQRKGRDHVTSEVPLSNDAREALETYLETERINDDGRLFQSRNGQPISQQVIDQVVRRIAAHANSKLPVDQHIEVSPHVLRHTSLRKWAEKKGIRYARQISGQVSDRYIWRYTQPSRQEIRDAADTLWE